MLLALSLSTALADDPAKIVSVSLSWTKPPAEAARWLGDENEVLHTLDEELAKRGLEGTDGATLDVEVTSLVCRVRAEASCTVTTRFVLKGDPAHTLDRTITEERTSSGPGAARFAARSAVRGAFATVLSEGPFASLDPNGIGDRPPTWKAPVTLAACPEATLTLPKDLPTIMAATGTVRFDQGSGSGVTISPDGFVLTAAHVVGAANGGTLTYRLPDGKDLPATVVRTDWYQDVALLRVTADGPLVCVAPTAETQVVGVEIYAVGSPLGEDLSQTVSKGIVSGLRKIEELRFIQTDAPVNPGNSGGPLVDLSGHVVGIVTFKVIRGEGLAFGVPMATATDRLGFALGAKTDGDFAPGWRGRRAGGAPVTVRAAATEPVPDVPETSIERSNYDGGAAKGGLAIAGYVGISVGGPIVLATVLLRMGGLNGQDAPFLPPLELIGWPLLVGGVGCAIGSALVDDPGLVVGPGFVAARF